MTIRTCIAFLFAVLISGPLAAGGIDTDADGVPDSIDNCSLQANPDQRDTNNDGFGNACDPDLNNDGFVNFLDLSQFEAAFFTPALDEDFSGDGFVNFLDLSVMDQYFFLPPGPGATGPMATYTDDVQPIFAEKCTPCHTGLGVGGHNIGVNYADAFITADTSDCDGLVVGECTIVLIQAGEMPQGAGCSGDPAQDAGNSACLTADQQATVQTWIDEGMPE